LTNLVVGVLATGTHERYFFHAFPFLWIGFTGLRARLGRAVPSKLIVQVAFAAFVSRCVVYSILRPETLRLIFLLRSQAFAAAVLLIAAALLYVGFLRLLLHLILDRDASDAVQL